MKTNTLFTLISGLLTMTTMATNMPLLRPSNNLSLMFLNPAYMGLNKNWEVNVNSVYSYTTESVMWGIDTRFYSETIDLKTGASNTVRGYGRNLSIQQIALQKQVYQFKGWLIGAGIGFNLERLDQTARGRHLNAGLSVLKHSTFGKISVGMRLSRFNYNARQVQFPETVEGQTYDVKLNRFNSDLGIQFTNIKDRFGLGIAYNNLKEETIDQSFRDTSNAMKYYRTLPSNLSLNIWKKSTLRNHLFLLKSIYVNIHPSLKKNYSEMLSLILYKEVENKACFGGGMFYMGSRYGRVIGPIIRFQYNGLKMQYNMNLPLGRIIQTISMSHELTLSYVIERTQTFKPMYTPEF